MLLDVDRDGLTFYNWQSVSSFRAADMIFSSKVKICVFVTFREISLCLADQTLKTGSLNMRRML
jgi:hypothetical protein